MNDYASSSEVSPISRTTVPAVTLVQTSATAPRSTDNGAPATARIVPAQTNMASIDNEAAGAAEYAKIHVEIADILADLRSASSALTVDDAAGAIQSLMPVPIVLVPLPPASKEAVEHAAVIARRMVEKAAYAKIAQAAPSRSIVDQVASAG